MIGDKSNTPLVSVIIPFFNAEKFLGEAIESVLAETYENWELLLMDDGSHNGSTAIARRYAELHPRARYFEHDGHQNRGVCAARNLGVRHAKGEYLAFLDGDDVWLPRKLAEQVAILDRERAAGMVFGNPIYWRSWTGRAEDADYVPGLGVPADTLVMPPDLLTALYPLGSGNAPCPSDILLRRGVVEEVGGFEEEFHRKYQLFEDQAFFSKVYLKHPVFVAGQSWLRYRIHPDSVDSVVAEAGEYHTVRQYYLNWLENYLSRQGTPSPEVRRALEAALWPYHHPLRQQMKMSARGFLGKVKGGVKAGARRVLPVSARRWLRARRHGPDYCPPVGWVDFGDLRRVKPLSSVWGLDRGQPVDRYYIEQFLAAQAGDIQGRVLEISDDVYTRRFGDDRITKSDVLHPVAGNPKATIVADLTSGQNIPSDAFDCIICTQTLLVIYDVRAVINNLYRILKPGGVLLVTIPGVSHQISRKDMDQWGDFWRFTSLSARRLFEEKFPSENVTIKTKGNVLTAAAFLYGLAAEELTREELDYNDRDYEVSIAVRAVKPG